MTMLGPRELLDGHSPGFVLAAAVICTSGAWLLMHLLRQAQDGLLSHRRWWAIAAAIVAGTGVWTTHFVAMLGYRTDLALGYDPGRTALSGLAAIVAVGGPLALSTGLARASTRALAGAASGFGIWVMHITGMTALIGCGQVQSPGANAAACTIGVVCMAAACARPTRTGAPSAAVLLVVTAVCGTHFASIAGTELAGEQVGRLLPGMQGALSVLAAAGAAVLLLGASLALLAARRFEAREKAHARVLATALQNMSNGIMKISGAEVVELFNPRLCAMLDLPPGGMVRGMGLAAFLELVERANGWDAEGVAHVLASHRAWMASDRETLVEHTFGDGRTLSIACQPVEDGAVLTLDDVTRVKQAQREILHLAYHDPLTGLANRRFVNERMHQARGDGRPFTLLVIDLDRFKPINDTFGHAVGDRLLVNVAVRLQDLIGANGFAARLGGDEMAVVAFDDHASAVALAERIVAEIEKPHVFAGFSVVVGCSVGLCGSGDAPAIESLMQRADIALYEAKRRGRGCAVSYMRGMLEAVAERSQLETDLRAALADGQFRLAYQPIVSLADDGVAGFEALMRWRHPDRGDVSPGEFIPLAEETGLIVPLGAWVLREACREAAGWPVGLRVAVNVSPTQFRHPGLEHAVLSALAASGLAPGRLEIEITESTLMGEGKATTACLHRLRAIGARIALDDFGTGYSSLSYLRRFPFDKIKIDRSFIRDIADPDAAAIVRAVVGIGERLGMGIVAEGVETAEQLELVRREGCTQVQGFLFSRPLPPEEARAYVLAARAKAA